MFWWILVGVALTFSIGFGLGALWASHMGSVFLIYRDDDPEINDAIERAKSNGHAREYVGDPYDLTDGWPPGEVR